MRKLFALALAVWATATIATPASPTKNAPTDGKEPRSIRGVAWGATKAEAESILHFNAESCYASILDENEVTCGEDFKLGEVDATAQYTFHHDRMTQVKLSYAPGDMGFVREVFIEKYGPPTTMTNPVLQNSMGARYGDTATLWKFPNVEIEMHMYGMTIDRGVTFITDLRWERAQRARKEDSKAKAADALDGPMPSPTSGPDAGATGKPPSP